MNESPFSEYGEEKSLQGILEDLVLYCAMNMANPKNIRVILPKKAIESHNKSVDAKQKVTLTDKDLLKNEVVIMPQWTSQGSIWIHAIEDNEEIIQGLV